MADDDLITRAEPRNQREEPMSKIIDAQDILIFAHGYIECVFMAASSLPKDQGDPIRDVTYAASTKIDEAIALLEEYTAIGEGPSLSGANEEKS